MNRDILDRVAAEETAETGVTPEEGPRRSRSAQYLLNASAQLLDAALKKEEAYNRISNKLELVRRAELLKVLAGVLEASPSISTQIVASHRIEQMKKVDEQVLINNIKEYSAEVKESRRSWKEGTRPGANTRSNSGNATETDQARAYLQRAKVAEAQQRGFDLSHLENLRKGDVQFQEDAHATQGLEKGATRFFQQAQDPTATGNPDDDFEGAIQWFMGKVRSMNLQSD
ncbi:hypothetical protein KC356_g5424 [Hortaea werneckii]|nr:hypothetical protein KC356_g5424 [Hortaea werneckii]